jgi:hypothetical protein
LQFESAKTRVEQRLRGYNTGGEMKLLPLSIIAPMSFLASQPFLEGGEDVVIFMYWIYPRTHWQPSVANYTTNNE